MAHTLDILSTFGEDALENHFAMIIPVFPNALGIENLNLRVLTFDLPGQEIGTYEIVKRGKKMTRPSGVSEQSKEFTFTFRVDKYFTTYNSLSRWMGMIQNPTLLTMASDSGALGAGGASTYRIPILVNGLDTNNIITNVWSFDGCYPSSLDGISFSEESGDPIVVSCTMQFKNIYYPGIPR